MDYETVAGALGARSYHDGTDAVRIHASGAANLPVESMELAYPLQVVRYELIRDGGGPGTFRGGLPVRRDTRILAQGTTVSTSGDRQTRPAAGLRGGLAGTPGRFAVNPNTPTEETIPTVTASLPLRPGDVVSVCTPGGGGFGDPLERDPRHVLGDLLDERISAQAAEDVYGVIIREGQPDLRATGRMREKLVRQRIQET